MKNIILLFLRINILKTLYLNFRYFKFFDAIKFPILVYPNTTLEKVEGKIVLKCPVKRGVITLGKHGLGNRLQTIWLVWGTLIVHGNVHFGSGTKISIGKDATLEIGRNLSVTGDTSIICKRQIEIGDDCIISWDDLIMDTDFHQIYDQDGNLRNQPSPIFIGDKVWITCRVTILKGSVIPMGSVIACSSLITSKHEVPNTIIGGGNKAMYIKQNIQWKK